VILESIERFKGLDAPVVVIVSPEPFHGYQSLFVSGISRAVVKCIIIHDNDTVLSKIEARELTNDNEYEQDGFVVGEESEEPSKGEPSEEEAEFESNESI
jgi:hypothetical protein